MKLFNLVLIIVLAFSAAPPVSARKHKKHKENKEHKKQIVEKAAAVIIQPRLEPLKDAKVLSKFENAQQIKAEVDNIDKLDETALKKQLHEVHVKREKQSQALNHLRQNELANIHNRRIILQEAKTALEEQGLEPTSAKGLMNKVKYMVKDTQMKQVISDEAAVEARVKKLTDQVAVNQMFENYLTKKVGQ
ncbi:MAG: hypothetical protein O3C63_02435 [Cyanobacteria bacterium]|nr:hypothetical protein [Cyanobacteriota bacterium]MDA1021309.1 hypothetical protein [Cyanobacteriota bacterium]